MKSLLLVPAAFALLTAFHPAPATTTPAEGAATWKIDPVHSSAIFCVKHANASKFYGVFKAVNGEFTIDADKAENCKVEATIATDSVDTRNDDRDKHLRSPDFFDAKQFPTLKFTSTKVTAKGKDAYEVVADVELHGKKAPVTATVTKIGEGEFQGKRVGYEAVFTLKRSEFGMTYGIDKKVLADEVLVTIAVEGVVKK